MQVICLIVLLRQAIQFSVINWSLRVLEGTRAIIVAKAMLPGDILHSPVVGIWYILWVRALTASLPTGALTRLVNFIIALTLAIGHEILRSATQLSLSRAARRVLVATLADGSAKSNCKVAPLLVCSRVLPVPIVHKLPWLLARVLHIARVTMFKFRLRGRKPKFAVTLPLRRQMSKLLLPLLQMKEQAVLHILTRGRFSLPVTRCRKGVIRPLTQSRGEHGEASKQTLILGPPLWKVAATPRKNLPQRGV